MLQQWWTVLSRGALGRNLINFIQILGFCLFCSGSGSWHNIVHRTAIDTIRHHCPRFRLSINGGHILTWSTSWHSFGAKCWIERQHAVDLITEWYLSIKFNQGHFFFLCLELKCSQILCIAYFIFLFFFYIPVVH